MESTLKIFGDFFVPKGNISLVVVDDWAQLGVSTQVGHEFAHALDTLDEVYDFLFQRLIVEGSSRVLDGLSKDSGQPRLHSGMSERILMISAVRWPRRIVGINLTTIRMGVKFLKSAYMHPSRRSGPRRLDIFFAREVTKMQSYPGWSTRGR